MEGFETPGLGLVHDGTSCGDNLVRRNFPNPWMSKANFRFRATPRRLTLSPLLPTPTPHPGPPVIIFVINRIMQIPKPPYEVRRDVISWANKRCLLSIYTLTLAKRERDAGEGGRGKWGGRRGGGNRGREGVCTIQGKKARKLARVTPVWLLCCRFAWTKRAWASTRW